VTIPEMYLIYASQYRITPIDPCSDFGSEERIGGISGGMVREEVGHHIAKLALIHFGADRAECSWLKPEEVVNTKSGRIQVEED
jgi:hypothetical protein